MNLQDIALRIGETNSVNGFALTCQPLPGDVDLLQVTVEGFDEIPVYLSQTDTQLLCISYLWVEDEVKPELKAEMMEAMLDMNIPMPLSSFSRIGERYVVFGALSINSSFDDIAEEIVTLAENSLDALEALGEYLK